MTSSYDDAAYVLQLAIGIVFLMAGVSKALSARSFVQIVRDYAILPPSATVPVAGIVIGLEVLVALALLSGAASGLAILLALMLVAGFGVSVGINLLRDRNIACGCFGSSEQISAATLIRLVVLLAACITVFARTGLDPVVTTWSLFANDGLSPTYVLDAWFLAAFLVVAFGWLARLSDLRVVFALQPGESQGSQGQIRE